MHTVAAWDRLYLRWCNLKEQYDRLNLCRASDDRILNYVEMYDECLLEYGVHHNSLVDGFNNMVGHSYAYDRNEYKTHNQLLELMDKKYLEEFMKVADDYDKARITCLQNNGTMTWLNIAYNERWSVKFSNNQCIVC